MIRDDLRTPARYAIATVVLTFSVALSVAYGIDHFAAAPRQDSIQTAVDQSIDNGEGIAAAVTQVNISLRRIQSVSRNVCGTARALAHVVLAFSDTTSITRQQRAALAELTDVADRCER